MDYLESFIDEIPTPSVERKALMSDVKELIRDYFASHDQAGLMQPPFRLIHADFDGQNILFSAPNSETGDPPRLTAVIDWEYSYAGPLYFLYDYPIFIQDVSWSKNLYERNAELRSAFCHALREQFAEGTTDREDARAALPSGKSARLNNFARLFMGGMALDTLMMEKMVRGYVMSEMNGSGKAYSGRIDWVPDPDI
jgi:hypothetical protein